jgi:hypothetical protein
VNDIGFDATRPQRTCQPEAVATGVEGDSDAHDRAPFLGRLILPALQQPQQRCLVWLELLQRVSLDPGDDPGNEPTRLAHLMTAMSMISCSSTARDLLKLFGCGMGTPSVVSGDKDALSSPLAP